MDKVAGGMPIALSMSAGDSACATNEISLYFSVEAEHVQNERTPAYGDHDSLEIACHRNNHGIAVRFELISVTARVGRGAREFRA